MEEPLALDDIMAANADFDERAAALAVSVTYDEEFDIFLLTLGDPQEAITEEVRDGLQMRLDPPSLKIVGFEILGFRRRYLNAHPDFRRHFEALFEHSPVERRDIAPRTRQRTQAQAALRELTPALG